MSHIVLEGVTKSFTKDQPVVKDLDLKIDPGEFVVLLGPSGCGKTTTLRIIAGLEKVTSGQVYIDDRPVTNRTLPTFKRLRQHCIRLESKKVF